MLFVFQTFKELSLDVFKIPITQGQCGLYFRVNKGKLY